jgi:MerR family transcriptional regulator, heat shock protein HspR
MNTNTDHRPLYTIATAAELLGVHPRTLRLYEAAGLLKPSRRNNRRLYSNSDLHWIRCIRYLIHEKGLNQEGLRRLLAFVPCWEIRGCPADAQVECAARRDRTAPCWTIASLTCQQDNKCVDCQVYMHARSQAVSDEEVLAATWYGPELPA